MNLPLFIQFLVLFTHSFLILNHEKESNVKSDNQPTTARTQENKDAYVPVSAVGECKYKDNGGADGTQQGKNSKAEFEGKTKYYNYNSIFVSSTIMI